MRNHSRPAGRGWHWQALRIASGLCLTCCTLLRGDAPAQNLYAQNFEQLQEGKPPEELLILAGAFQIKSIENNKALVLEPNPLDTFGALFGPAERDAYTVSTRIRASNTGRRFPEFGVGALGPSGYKLWLMPATGQLQLKAGDEVITHVPYQWKSGQWTRLKLQLTRTPDNKTKLQGKAWADGAQEPGEWTISAQHDQPPKAGRAVLWAVPYGGTPTYFDDLLITPAR